MEIKQLRTTLDELEPFNYVFQAIRGIQAGREYYITMCPMNLIPKLFLFNENELPPKMRAQRTLNRSRIPRIAEYLIDNTNDYILSSITASVDGKVEFMPLGQGKNEHRIGYLVIPMSARFVINDGQHRRAAIERALETCPELGKETISVVFFIDAGLTRSQQMFADLNQHAVRPTRSLSILYNHRDQKACATIEIVESVLIFKGLTDMEKTTISNRSIKLFTLSSVYRATMELLGKKRSDSEYIPEEVEIAKKYWTKLGEIIPEWQLVIKKKVSSSELRREYVHVHGVLLHALGRAGQDLIVTYPKNWSKVLEKLIDVDWRRTNIEMWEGRAMIGGRLSKADMNVKLTTNILKKILGLKLKKEEKEIEKKLLSNNSEKEF